MIPRAHRCKGKLPAQVLAQRGFSARAAFKAAAFFVRLAAARAPVTQLRHFAHFIKISV